MSFKAEKVPTLEEALLFTQEKQWKVNLELKKLPRRFKDFPVPQKVIEMIKKTGIKSEQIIISSFNHRWLERVHYMAPEIEIQALIGYSNTPPLDWGDFSFDIYNAQSTLIDEQQIKTAREKGKKINLFTVNRIEEMKRFIRLGIDGIITDYPQLLKSK